MNPPGKRLAKRIMLGGCALRFKALFILTFFCAGYCGAQNSSKTAPQPTFWIVFEQLDVPTFSVDHLPSVDIFVMDQNGHRTKRLTSNHRSHNPSWSPDGRQIAFLTGERTPEAPITSDEDFNDFVQYRDFLKIPLDVFRMDADGRNPARIVSLGPDAQDVFWFPGGNRVGVRMSDRASLQVLTDTSGRYPPEGQWSEPLSEYLNTGQPLPSGGYDPSYANLLAWVPPLDNFMPTFVSSYALPSSENLDRVKALLSAANLHASLRVISLDGTSSAFPIPAYDLSWSKDGKRVAYSSFSREEKSIVYLAEMRDGNLESGHRALTDESLDAHGPAWSFDGSRIAFTGLWEGSSQIFVMGADGTGLAQLSRNSKISCYHLSWSPDGNWIVADCRENVTVMRPFTYELGGLSNVYLFDVNRPGTKPRQLTKCMPMFALPPPTCGARNPSFAPAPGATP